MFTQQIHMHINGSSHLTVPIRTLPGYVVYQNRSPYADGSLVAQEAWIQN